MRSDRRPRPLLLPRRDTAPVRLLARHWLVAPSPVSRPLPVERNTAQFTAGEEELTVEAGHLVLVPANTPHRYVGASDEAVRVLSVQPSGTVEQTNL